MGNTLEGAVAYLKDPFLVRRIQEYCGVTQITLEEDSTGATGEQSPASSSDEGVNPASDSGSGGDGPTKKGHRRLSSRDSNSNPNGTAVAGSGSTYSIEWLKSNIKVRKRLRSSPSPVPSRTASPEPENEQKTTPSPVEVIVESYPLLDIYFRLAAELGYEPFYITFLPAMLWNVDSLVARHVVIIWCISMYVGQACKQLFKIRRPDSPPALRLEQNPDLETEYGFPSTHAIVSTTIPFYYLYSCFGRYEFPLWLGLMISVTWSISVCLSRIYLGVHSLLDIIGGVTISVVMLCIIIPAMDHIDHFLLHNISTIPIIILTVIFLLYIYPVDKTRWTMDRGDTAAILGVCIGVVSAFSLHGPYPDDLDPGPYVLSVPSLHVASLSVVRFIVGILLLLPSRFVMKLLCFKLLPAIMPTHGVEEVVKRPLVELPYKLITYSTIGFNAIYLAPIIFEICGINRWEDGIAW